MFEDKKRKRIKRVVFLIFLMFVGGAFAIGYYLNVDSGGDITVPNQGDKSSYQVPDRFINPDSTASEGDASDNYVGELIGILGSDTVGPSTKLTFRTSFTKCGHSIEKKSVPTADEMKMTKEKLSEKYEDWELEEFTRENVIFKRVVSSYCPNHYIIGIYSGNIAVYVYNENGEKVLKEETEISIATLTPEDQKALHEGILADNEEELYLKIEGFSN